MTEREFGPLVETGWLEEHIGEPDLRIIDATVQIKMWPIPRIRSGRSGWKRAHIPGAVFADLRRLSDPDRPTYSFAMPSATWFAHEIGQLGIGDYSRVVIYDARENMWAARLWWMFRAFGFTRAAVLNGGWFAWSREGRPICKEPCGNPEASFTARPCDRDLMVGKEEVLAAIEEPATCIVSALGRRQHRGERNEYRRRGHIPGARNVTAWEILDRESQRYRSPEELRQKFGTILDADRIITYCGAGIAGFAALIGSLQVSLLADRAMLAFAVLSRLLALCSSAALIIRYRNQRGRAARTALLYAGCFFILTDGSWLAMYALGMMGFLHAPLYEGLHLTRLLLFSAIVVVYLGRFLDVLEGTRVPGSDDEKLDPYLVAKYSISRREEEITRHLRLRRTNEEIAERLFISIRTVKGHLYRNFQKTNVKSRVQLANLFANRGRTPSESENSEERWS